MTSYILIICTLLFLAFLSYIVFEKDILAPPFITSGIYCFAMILALYGLRTWNMVERLERRFIIAVLLGIEAFIIGGLIAKYLKNYIEKKKAKPKKKKNEDYKFKAITIKPWKWVLLYIFVPLTIALVIIEIKRICNMYGFFSNSIPKLLSFYRTKTSIFSKDLIINNTDIHFLIRQMKKVCEVLAIISAYILINNIYAKAKIKDIIIPGVLLILCFIETVFTSGRALIMRYGVAIAFFIIYFYQKKYKKVNRKLIIGIGLMAFVFLLSFYIILPLIGRSTNDGFLSYISFYLGAPMTSFNLFLKHGYDTIRYSNLIAEETFSNIYVFLGRIKVLTYYGSESHYTWIPYLSAGQSNVYSALRDYYYDFGNIGVVVFQLIAGFVTTFLYYKTRENNIKPLSIIIYANYFYILIDQIRTETFYNLISLPTVAYLLLFAVLYFCIFIFDFKEIYTKIKRLRAQC